MAYQPGAKLTNVLTQGTPAQKLATTKYLQENLSPEQQAGLLNYFQKVTAPPTPASNPDSLTVSTDMTVQAPTTQDLGVDMTGVEDLTINSGNLGGLDLNTEFDKLISGAADITQSFLKGEIPKEVQDMLISQSGEQALISGIGSGSAARNLTARDLGLYSTQLMQTGVSMAQGLAGQLEAKRQYNINTQTAINEFNKNYSLERAKLQDQLSQTALDEQQRLDQVNEFNASQVLEQNKLIAQIIEFGQQLQFQYATTKGEGGEVDTTGLQTDVANLTSDIEAL